MHTLGYLFSLIKGFVNIHGIINHIGLIKQLNLGLQDILIRVKLPFLQEFKQWENQMPIKIRRNSWRQIVVCHSAFSTEIKENYKKKCGICAFLLISSGSCFKLWEKRRRGGEKRCVVAVSLVFARVLRILLFSKFLNLTPIFYCNTTLAAWVVNI